VETYEEKRRRSRLFSSFEAPFHGMVSVGFGNTCGPGGRIATVKPRDDVGVAFSVLIPGVCGVVS